MVANLEYSLSKPQVYESKRIQLTSQILHIGSAVSQLSPFEYVATGSRVYLPNSDLLAQGLYHRGKLQEYIRRIENREEITPLLKETFGNNWQTQKFNNESLFPATKTLRKWTDQKITDLRPMIRNGFGQLYIPGSSIKGAIRTAIAYHLLKYSDKYHVPQPQKISEVEKTLRYRLDKGNLKSAKNQKKADDKLFMESLFSDFSLNYQGKPARGKTSLPNTDFMRAVRVTDSEPLLESQAKNKQGKPIYRNLPVVTEVIVSSRFLDRKAKYKCSLYVEMVWQVKTEFTITINPEMLSWFRHNQGMEIPFENIDDILNICQEFAQDQWEAEAFYWEGIKNNPNGQGKTLDFSNIRSLYSSENCPFNLRIGWGSGMLGTTIDLLLDEELVEEIRDTCGLEAPNFEAPKSRRTVVSAKGEIKYVPGWIKFRF
ncbi:MAG: type III-A CRISPR-associated RAMP protein Csm5 [Microcoleaceae cyanobacterium]